MEAEFTKAEFTKAESYKRERKTEKENSNSDFLKKNVARATNVV